MGRGFCPAAERGTVLRAEQRPQHHGRHHSDEDEHEFHGRFVPAEVAGGARRRCSRCAALAAVHAPAPARAGGVRGARAARRRHRLALIAGAAPGRPPVDGVEVQLDRLCAGLADLDAARGGRRAPAGRVAVDLGRFVDASLAPWRSSRRRRRSGRAGARAERRPRPARPGARQPRSPTPPSTGAGAAELRTRAIPSGVRLELRNLRGPAARAGSRAAAAASRSPSEATRELGGRLEVRVEGDQVVAALDLPADAPRAA